MRRFGAFPHERRVLVDGGAAEAPGRRLLDQRAAVEPLRVSFAEIVDGTVLARSLPSALC